MVFDDEQSTGKPSPERCILNKWFLAIFGFVVTLTFDLLTSKSTQFIFSLSCKFGEIPTSGSRVFTNF